MTAKSKKIRNSPGPCTAKKVDGTRCRAPRVAGSKLCWYHQFPEKAQENRLKGIAAQQAPKFVLGEMSLKTPANVMEFIASAIKRTLDKEISPAMGFRLVKMAEALLKAMEAADKQDPGMLKKTDKELIFDWARILRTNGDEGLISYAIECLRGKHDLKKGSAGAVQGDQAPAS